MDNKYSMKELESIVEFLYYWAIRQDEKIRHLSSKLGVIDIEKKHNDDAFQFKWNELHKGRYSPINPIHQEEAIQLVMKYTELPAEWFCGKRVLDAGCGDGRFSMALCRLGAIVTAFDITDSGVMRTAEVCKDFKNFESYKWDVLQPILAAHKYDLIFCFGVLHHTGDIEKGIRNLSDVLADGGYFFFLVYGYPRLDHPGDFSHMVKKEKYRQAAKGMPFEELKTMLEKNEGVEAARGWFDATTPQTEEHFTFEQLVQTLCRYGFGNIKRTMPDARNHAIVARKLR